MVPHVVWCNYTTLLYFQAVPGADDAHSWRAGPVTLHPTFRQKSHASRKRYHSLTKPAVRSGGDTDTLVSDDPVSRGVHGQWSNELRQVPNKYALPPLLPLTHLACFGNQRPRWGGYRYPLIAILGLSLGENDRRHSPSATRLFLSGFLPFVQDLPRWLTRNWIALLAHLLDLKATEVLSHGENSVPLNHRRLLELFQKRSKASICFSLTTLPSLST